MAGQHRYKATIRWTGNNGQGTDNYRNYERSHQIIIEDKVPISGSSDPAFRGDRTKHNPEDLFVSALSSCHMLWYLHLCSEAGVIVTEYEDHATGLMEENADGSGQFSEVTLNPTVTVIEPSMVIKAKELHKTANERCFIANSVNFPVLHNPTVKIAESK